MLNRISTNIELIDLLFTFACGELWKKSLTNELYKQKDDSADRIIQCFVRSLSLKISAM